MSGPTSTQRCYRPILGRHQRRRCVYCGCYASCRDHVRPWSVFHEPGWLPACHACNIALSDRVHDTLGERCMSLAVALRRRHKQLLARDIEAQMEGTEGLLRRALSADQVAQQVIHARLSWMAAMAATTKHLVLEGLISRPEDCRALEEFVRGLTDDLQLTEREEIA